MGYAWRALRAQVREGRTLFLLAWFGTALGVASVVSVELLNRNAVAAFRGSVRAVSGDADLVVVGRTPVLPDSLFPRVLGTAGVDAAWPVARIAVAVRGSGTRFLDILGVDPVVQPPLPFVEEPPSGEAARDRLAAMFARPGWIAISPDLAAEAGWSPGDTIPVSSGSRSAALVVGALVDFRRASPLAARTLAVMDIAQVQGLLGGRGELEEIGVRAAPGVDPAILSRRLADGLGSGATIATPEARARRVEGLLDSFRLNLTALSLVSLFVGAFLVAASSQAALVRRRHELGVLRVLGASPSRVFAWIWSESLVLGLLGSALGLGLGIVAARRSMETVSATLTNVYLIAEIETIRVDAPIVALAALVGLGGALAGAMLPALDASRRDVRALLAPLRVHETAARHAPRLAVAGCGAVLLAAGGYLVAGTNHPYGGFLLALGVLLALPLLTPALLLAVASRVPARGWGLGLGLRALALRLQTSSFAVGALGAAVSMLVAVTLLVGSFRATLLTWLDDTLRADVFVTTESWGRSGRQATLDSTTVAVLAGTPGVASLERLRQFRAVAGDREIRVAGVDFGGGPPRRFALRHGDPDDVWRRLHAAGAVVVSEPLARKERLGVGDSLSVVAPGGVRRLPIAGVSYDYSSDAGAALMSLETLERVFGPGPLTNVALHLEPDVHARDFVDRLRAAFRGAPLRIREDGELRREVLEVFDQTFAVTRILQIMALGVAATGISLALLVLARERQAELALYRALGATRPQIFRLFVGEGMGMALVGLALGLVGGAALAAILIGVINPATFGWTIRPAWPGGALARAGAAILAAAFLASLVPALRASRAPARELSRDAV